jgi:hypothetical protein
MPGKSAGTPQEPLVEIYRRTPKNVLIVIILVAGLLYVVGIVNGYIWFGTNNAVRLIMAQTLEADTTAGLLALGIFLVLFELWKRQSGATNGPQRVEVVIRFPDGTVAVPIEKRKSDTTLVPLERGK